jgi:hypothetical protein
MPQIALAGMQGSTILGGEEFLRRDIGRLGPAAEAASPGEAWGVGVENGAGM